MKFISASTSVGVVLMAVVAMAHAVVLPIQANEAIGDPDSIKPLDDPDDPVAPAAVQVNDYPWVLGTIPADAPSAFTHTPALSGPENILNKPIDVAAYVQAVVDVIINCFVDIGLQLKIDVEALVLARVHADLEVAGISVSAGVKNTIATVIKASIEILVDLNVDANFKDAVDALIRANVKDDGVGIDVIVTGVRALIEARVSRVVAKVDAEVLAEVHARTIASGAIIRGNVDASVHLGLDIRAEVAKLLARIDAGLKTRVNYYWEKSKRIPRAK
ncbi:hypothetical protein BGX31_008266 [Mortierella sp. GBA43]|nr:hypothetical protein BGX31_008266 [Mortierella sp. GBA43]